MFGPSRMPMSSRIRCERRATRRAGSEPRSVGSNAAGFHAPKLVEGPLVFLGEKPPSSSAIHSSASESESPHTVAGPSRFFFFVRSRTGERLPFSSLKMMRSEDERFSMVGGGRLISGRLPVVDAVP